MTDEEIELAFRLGRIAGRLTVIKESRKIQTHFGDLPTVPLRK